jgi:hypothetical protein
MAWSARVRDAIDRVPFAGRAYRRLRRWRDRRRNRSARVANIAMLHAGRCGSSVLADLLDQRPDFHWCGEPFEAMEPYYYRLPGAIRAHERISDVLYRHRCRYFGFDSKYLPEQHLHRDLANQTPAGYVALLERLGFTHFILVDRRNHLRRAVSVAVGTRTGLWNTTMAPRARTAVRLDPLRFQSYGEEMPLLRYFESLERQHAVFRELLKGRRLLELCYEDDVEPDPRIGYRKTCEFLGIDALPVEVRLKRMNPWPLAELVENLDEVRSVLAGTRHAWMLDA